MEPHVNMTSQESLISDIGFGFRLLFYAILPSESKFSHPYQVPNYVDQAVPYFLTLLLVEIIVLQLKGMKHKMPRLNDTISSVTAGLVSQLPLLLLRNIEISSYMWLHKNYRVYELPWDSSITWILCMLGVDLGYYWVHRCAHEINFMWAGHQTHHSSQEYNLSTALRQGVFQRYSSWIFYLPLAFFIPPSVFMVHLQFNLIYQFWIHTEMIDRLGPLEYILNTPSHHRVHHGVNRYCIDKNYAGVLIIWDRIFGTFEPENRDDEVVYGLTHQINTWNPLLTQANHWMYILQSLWNAENTKHRLSIMLKGPGWTPGKPRLGCIEDIPDAHAPALKYNSRVRGICLNIYAVYQLLVSVLINHTLALNKNVSVWFLLIAVLFIIWTLCNIGFFYDRRPQAALSEVLRCSVILFVDRFFFSNVSLLQLDFIAIPLVRLGALLGLPLALSKLVVGESETKDLKKLN